MLFNVPVSVSGGGWASPSSFLVATVVLTIFSVGYIEMSRRVTAAGGFYSFITHAFGPVVGMGTAALISLCYVIFCAAVIGVTSYFASTSFEATMPITPRCHPSPETTMTVREPISRSESTVVRAWATISASSC